MIPLMVGIDHKSSKIRLDGTTITHCTRKPAQVTRRSGCGDDFTSVKGRIPFHCNSLWATIVIVIHCLSCQLERLLSHQRYWNLTKAGGFNPFPPSTRSNQTTPPDGAWPQLGWRWSSQATRLEMFGTFGTQYKQCQWDYVQKIFCYLGTVCHCLSQLDQVTRHFRPVHFCFTGHQIRCSICYMIFNQMILAFGVFEYNLHFSQSLSEPANTDKSASDYTESQFSLSFSRNRRHKFGQILHSLQDSQSFHASVVGVLFHRLCATRNCHISLFSQNATVFKIESRIEAYVKAIKTNAWLVLKHRQRGTRNVSFYRYDKSTLVSNRFVCHYWTKSDLLWTQKANRNSSHKMLMELQRSNSTYTIRATITEAKSQFPNNNAKRPKDSHFQSFCLGKVWQSKR